MSPRERQYAQVVGGYCIHQIFFHEFPLIFAQFAFFSDLKIPHSIFVEKEIVLLDAFIPT